MDVGLLAELKQGVEYLGCADVAVWVVGVTKEKTPDSGAAGCSLICGCLICRHNGLSAICPLRGLSDGDDLHGVAQYCGYLEAA
jgi:hypothetical protein